MILITRDLPDTSHINLGNSGCIKQVCRCVYVYFEPVLTFINFPSVKNVLLSVKPKTTVNLLLDESKTTVNLLLDEMKD